VLRQQVERIRKEHLAIEHEETRLGYMSMAVPVFGSSSVLAGALSVTAPTVRMNVSRFSGALRTAGLGISRTLQAMTRARVPWSAVSSSMPPPLLPGGLRLCQASAVERYLLKIPTFAILP
jgi:hypothetical protein